MKVVWELLYLHNIGLRGEKNLIIYIFANIDSGEEVSIESLLMSSESFSYQLSHY